MAKNKSISAEEAKWRAESDARILADANEILRDKARKNAAVKAAEKLAKHAALQAASTKKMTTKPQINKKGGKTK